MCFSFVMLHLGFYMTMELGLFPAICITYWIALLPGSFWDSSSFSKLLPNSNHHRYEEDKQHGSVVAEPVAMHMRITNSYGYDEDAKNGINHNKKKDNHEWQHRQQKAGRRMIVVEVVQRIERYMSFVWQCIAVALVLYIVLPQNLYSLGVSVGSSRTSESSALFRVKKLSRTQHRMSSLLRLKQRWSLFGKIMRKDGWFV